MDFYPVKLSRNVRGYGTTDLANWSRGIVTVLPTIVLQVLLDRAHGELPSDTRILTSHWEKFHGKIGKIWRSVIATINAVRVS